MVDSENDKCYKPPPEFEEENKRSLVDLNMTDSTELWLLKLPFSYDLLSEIDGQELSLNLHNDGKLATFEASSGKEYDFVSFASQEPDEIVFVASPTKPKIAGKISRRVSIVHYSDPKELQKANASNTRHSHRNSAGFTMTTSSRYFPMQSVNLQSSQSGLVASSKGSRKSSVSEVSNPSNAAERRHASDKDKSSTGSKVSELSHGHSTGMSSMSSDHSHGGKSKRRKHKE